MKNTPSACIILAAGKGTRMKSSLPKVLHAIAGRSMLGHVLVAAGAGLSPQKVVIVAAPGMEEIISAAQEVWPNIELAIQSEQLGTGHAVQSALPLLHEFKGIVFILYGDTPLIKPSTLQEMQQKLLQHKSAIAVLGMRPEDPSAYGRLIVNNKGELERIVEFKDATPAEQKINLCNSGVMAVKSEYLADWVGKLQNNNAKQEYYLTDIVALARSDKLSCIVVEAPEEDLLGVNDRVQLANAEYVLQQRLRRQAMQNGVTLIDPSSVYFSCDTQIAPDVIVEPHVIFGPGVHIEKGATIRAFSHLEQTKVGERAVIGPYARLRPGTEIGNKVRIGNFVEIKQAVVETGAKINHLSYIGDAQIGAHANIGAGTITCNYDGFQKHHTRVGEHAFIGSNTALVAPIEIGAKAIVGAGSVITEDVEPDSLSLTRPSQQHRHGWAKQFRLRKSN